MVLSASLFGQLEQKRKDIMKKSIGPRSIVYPTPTFIVGTYDLVGKPNVMTAAWGGICCSSPPCVAVSLRKATYTYGSIVEKKAFTISVPPEKYVKEVNYFGRASGRTEDKFLVSSLTPVRSDVVDAPYVQEFPFVLECELLNTFEIGLHTQFIGEIKDIKADEEIIGDKELPNIDKIKPIIFAPGAGTYYGLGNCLGDRSQLQ
jgi:flavin reductase (DIM6/NTAB) family NADH-FMN oxidoreductase RutF